MSEPIQHGYLLLADLSGYTSYLAGVELDHAHEILADLLETIVNGIQPRMSISKLEGDAAFAYAEDARLPRGESLLELVEATYVGFRDRQQAIKNRTTCTCRACRNIPSLDLKFIVHHGDFLLQKVHTGVEAIGSDVNLAHRLMKNGVTEATGWRAYAIYTAPAAASMGISLPYARLLVESYEHLGTVAIVCVDLHERYDAITGARRVFVERDDADQVLEREFAAPPAVVWEWFTDPAKRGQWMGAQIVPVLRMNGRQAAGARNHCIHGKHEVVVEDVLDLKPFDYFTIEQRPQGSRFSVRITFQFIPVNAGSTRMLFTIHSHGPWMPRWAGRLLTGYVMRNNLLRQWSFETLRRLIEGSQVQTDDLPV